MHSRRPPSLRHKGNRRESKKGRKSEQEHGDVEQPEQVTAVAPTRKKRKTGPCSPGTCLLVFGFLVLVLYAKYILSTASLTGREMQSESSVRGSLGMNSLPTAKPADARGIVPSTTSDGDKTTVAAHSDVKGVTEAEEQQWKELVKDQTTKREAKVSEVVSDVN
ncbi:hypothetical protein MHU86_10785 [Fragilaria crotonensis]|nr:hypothetical protein MHU86_10785 [Fragilaria crotonensis]